MNFLVKLYEINKLEENCVKLAGTGDIHELIDIKFNLWNRLKQASCQNIIKLGKLAKEISNQAYVYLDEKIAIDQSEYNTVLASFASALAVDQMINASEKTAEEKTFLLKLNADSALQDLQDLVKIANPSWYTDPKILAALGGTAGAGLGAWSDEENRLRGAVVGGIGGAALGGLGGLALQQMQDNANTAKAIEDAAKDQALKDDIGAAVNNFEQNKGGDPFHLTAVRKQLKEDLKTHSQAYTPKRKP